MDFSSNGVKFKNRNRKRLLVDSDSESDSNNDSNYSSLSSESNYVKHKKAAKRMRRYVCDSSTDSDTENDEQSESDCEYDKKTDFPSHSDNSNSNKSLKIEAVTTDPETVILDSLDKQEEESSRPKELKTSHDDFFTEDYEIPGSDHESNNEPQERDSILHKSLDNSETHPASVQDSFPSTSRSSTESFSNITRDVLAEVEKYLTELKDDDDYKTVNYSKEPPGDGNKGEIHSPKREITEPELCNWIGVECLDDEGGDVKHEKISPKREPAIREWIDIESSDDEGVDVKHEKKNPKREPTEPELHEWIKIESSDDENGDVKQEKISPKREPSEPKPQSWEEILSGLNSVQPVHTGEQGLNTFYQQKTETLKRLKTMHEAMESCPTEDKLAPTPDGLNIELMSHQRHALAWMTWRERQRPRGGILADDMGLGKTLSIIALVLASEQESVENMVSSDDEVDDDDDDVKRGEENINMGAWMPKKKQKKDLYCGGTLVSCPASVINQWKCEIENRVEPNLLSVCVHHGTNRESKARKLSENNIVITTYGVINSELKNNGPLFKIKWNRVVLDEGHIIRNSKTYMAQSCWKLKTNKRWYLSGTPIQNKEKDMYSVLKFLKCSPFDDLKVFNKYIVADNEGGWKRLSNLLRPMLLRRTKLQLQDRGELEKLPEKTVNVVNVTLKKDEMNVYSRILLLSQTLFAQFLEQNPKRHHSLNLKKFHRTKNSKDVFEGLEKFLKMTTDDNGVIQVAHILVLFTRLRQICDHPGLITKMLQEEVSEDSSDLEKENMPDIDILDLIDRLGSDDDNNNDTAQISKASSNIMKKSNPVFDFDNPSSKYRKTMEIVKDVMSSTTDKLVIVSQWTSVLDVFARYLRKERICFVEFTGKTPIKIRNDIVVSFNKPNSRERIMLLSLAAGGVGLNLVGANHIILVEPHWNPQLEAQAADRVYRMGQKKPVQIHKLLCENTIEDRIKTLQENKLKLADHVLTGSSSRQGSTKLSLKDLCALFDM